MFSALALLQGMAVLATATTSASDGIMERVAGIIEEMTLPEKLSMLAGVEGDYVGNMESIDRFGIPAVNMMNGPQGARDRVHGGTTSWPSALAVGATFDPDLAARWGVAMGKEFRGKGAHVALGPGVNIIRTPRSGRNWEYYGEDPFHQAAMVVPVIEGIQAEGVMATIKHFAVHSQEEQRFNVSANIDQRSAYELYYPAFEAAMDAGVASVMCAYNMVNNTFACDSHDLLETTLRQEWGFAGWVMSDWEWGARSTISANHGLEQEMPYALHYSEDKFRSALEAGSISIDRIDLMVQRILVPMLQFGLLDEVKPEFGSLERNVSTPEHVALSREMVAATHVLLKNDGNLLPLKAQQMKFIAVVGDAGHEAPVVIGGGSGSVPPDYIVSAFDGVQGTTASGDTEVRYMSTADALNFLSELANADAVIVVVGTTSGESADRDNLSLPLSDDALVESVARVNNNTVVVVAAPGAVLMPWIDAVSAVLIAFLAGQESGSGMADVLFGAVSPSARLPITLPNHENEVEFSEGQYPGIPDANGVYQLDYTEKLEVGYRWYDAHNVKALFPFGHGLTYSTFEFADMAVSRDSESIVVTFQLTNTGNVAAQEVAQLYVGFPTEYEEPPQQLKGFRKVALAPGQSTSVVFELSARDFSFFDVTSRAWKMATGDFALKVGSSSRNLPLEDSLTLF